MKTDFFRMINDDFVAYNENLKLLPETKRALREEIADCVEQYGWVTGNGHGIDVMLDKWWENKGKPMAEMFGSHPNYVKGKFMIVLKDESYIRGISQYIAYDFKRYIVEVLYGKYVKKFKLMKMENPDRIDSSEVASTSLIYIPDYGLDDFNILKSDLKIAKDVQKIMSIIDGDIYDGLITEKMVEEISQLENTFHIHKGMKATRYIGKICRELKINDDAHYNQKFTEFCDAYSPKAIKRITVLSWNPLDYLRMSMGNSWTSCHTIDVNDDDDGYSGMHCGGTESYMLDNVSIQFYTVDEKYDGTDYELQPKIERCMFHIDPERNYFIQGRMYPQCNDAASGIYKSVREVVQRIIAESWNINNSWLYKKGTSECSKLITSEGGHYRDYRFFEECNVSYNKNVDNVKDKAKRIIVGHSGICIQCGVKHYNKGSIACDIHSINTCTCSSCGCIIDYDDRIYCESTESYYCPDCVIYCDCCGEYYPEDMVMDVEDYGYVCEDCIKYSDKFLICGYCDKTIYIDSPNLVITEDGYSYCDDECACMDGYVYDEDRCEWVFKEKLDEAI